MERTQKKDRGRDPTKMSIKSIPYVHQRMLIGHYFFYFGDDVEH